jgi:hypothetical protein
MIMALIVCGWRYPSPYDQHPAGARPLSPPQPDFASIKALVLDAVPSLHSRRAYDRALTDFLAWYAAAAGQGFSKAAVERYARHLEEQGLAASTRNVRLTAVRHDKDFG